MVGMNDTNLRDDEIRQTGARLWRQWTEMWNGSFALARTLVAPRFVLHLVKPSAVDEQLIATPEAVERWVREHCAKFERLVFHPDCGPFVDTARSVVAGPWWAEASTAGVASSVCGMDTLAFRAGRVTEYWTLSRPAEDVGRWTDVVAPFP